MEKPKPAFPQLCKLGEEYSWAQHCNKSILAAAAAATFTAAVGMGSFRISCLPVFSRSSEREREKKDPVKLNEGEFQIH